MAGTSGMTGKWSIQGRRDGRIRLQLQPSANAVEFASFSTQLALTELQGLTEEQLVSSARAKFQLVRAAGTFAFSGAFRARVGKGEWAFNAATAFIAVLREHGYTRPTNEQLFALAASDVNAAYLESWRSADYKAIALDELVALSSNGVTADDARAFRELLSGYISTRQLIALKTNGVGVPYINSLAEVGYKRLSALQLIALRTNGVDREFIDSAAERGHRNLTVTRLLSLRTNGF